VLSRGIEAFRRSALARRLMFLDRPRLLVSRRSRRVAAASPARDVLTPILVDYYTRDGSTLMMRLLGSSAQIAVGGAYPFEQKYFAYLWRWSRLLASRDWDEEAWSPRNLATILQERDSALMGPPPWRRRELLETTGPDEPSFSRSCFEFAWREFSRRAAVRTRLEHGSPRADVRYYAEKHLNSWLVDRSDLPPLRVVVLLRDPRDTYVSLLAFRDAAGADLGQRHARDDEDYLRQFIDRQRERLRWISGLQEDGQTLVVRYEDLVSDLAGVATRLERWLGVSLDADAVIADRRMKWMHRTSTTTEESIGRWRSELDSRLATAISDELGGELSALGFET
jgi:Sulfotransferase family